MALLPEGQCPERGPALPHVRDLKFRDDGGCVFCGVGAFKQNVCRGFGCIEMVSGEFCEDCIQVRAQTAVSHKLEGHRQAIYDCPACETWKV